MKSTTPCEECGSHDYELTFTHDRKPRDVWQICRSCQIGKPVKSYKINTLEIDPDYVVASGEEPGRVAFAANVLRVAVISGCLRGTLSGNIEADLFNGIAWVLSKVDPEIEKDGD